MVLTFVVLEIRSGEEKENPKKDRKFRKYNKHEASWRTKKVLLVLKNSQNSSQSGVEALRGKKRAFLEFLHFSEALLGWLLMLLWGVVKKREHPHPSDGERGTRK